MPSYRQNHYRYHRQPDSHRYDDRYNYYRDYRKADRYEYYYRQPDPYPNPYPKEKKKKKSSRDDGPIPVRTRRAMVILGMLTVFINAFLIGAPFWRSTMGWYGAARMTNYWGFEGLFLSCIRQGYQALSQCYNLYPIMGAVDGEAGVRSGKDHNIYPSLTSFRALMIIAMVFSVTGVICSALGMRCATIIKENSKQKRWVLLAGGASHFLAGLFTGICVSWYAGEVLYEFYAITYQTVRMKFTLGACLYVGWISMVISLICGCLMTCCICCKSSDEEEEFKMDYNYRPSLQVVTAAPAPGIDKAESFNEHEKPDTYHHHSRRSSCQVTSRKDSKNHDTDYYRPRSHSYHGSRRNSHVHDTENYSSSRRSSKAESHHHHTSSRRGSKHNLKSDHHPSSRRESRKHSTHFEVNPLLFKDNLKEESSQSSKDSSNINIPGTVNGFV